MRKVRTIGRKFTNENFKLSGFMILSKKRKGSAWRDQFHGAMKRGIPDSPICFFSPQDNKIPEKTQTTRILFAAQVIETYRFRHLRITGFILEFPPIGDVSKPLLLGSGITSHLPMIGAWKNIIRWDFLKIPLLVSKPKLVHPIPVRMPKILGGKNFEAMLSIKAAPCQAASRKRTCQQSLEMPEDRMRKWQKKTRRHFRKVFFETVPMILIEFWFLCGFLRSKSSKSMRGCVSV